MIWFKEHHKKGSRWKLPVMAVFKGFLSDKSYFYLLLGFAILILSANLGLPPLWGSEGRWALIARSMLRSGDLLSPVLGIRDYWDKPFLSYWQILPLSYIDGDVSEFTARFPSVVWAVVMLLLTRDLAKRWFVEQIALVSVGILLGFAMIVLFGASLLLYKIFPAGTDTIWFASVLLALPGVTMIASTMRKYIWGMVESVLAVWLIYVIGLMPLIAQGPNLKTKVAEVNALGKPCGLLNIYNAKLKFYLDKPCQVFDDETRALYWATRAGGVLITSSDVSDQSWECVVKGNNWQAVIPRKIPPLNDSSHFR